MHSLSMGARRSQDATAAATAVVCWALSAWDQAGADGDKDRTLLQPGASDAHQLIGRLIWAARNPETRTGTAAMQCSSCRTKAGRGADVLLAQPNSGSCSASAPQIAKRQLGPGPIAEWKCRAFRGMLPPAQAQRVF